MTKDKKHLANFLLETLTDGGWRGVSIDEDTGDLTCPIGPILKKIPGNMLELSFIYYAGTPPNYGNYEKYSSIIFPEDFDIRDYLYINERTGRYGLSYIKQFKKVVNNTNNDCATIQISPTSERYRRFHKDKLIVSKDVFRAAMADANNIYRRQKSLSNSVENYLSKEAAHKYSSDVKKNTTYAVKGEATFFVDRLNIATKRKKADFDKYLNDEDKKSLETLSEQLIRRGVFSDDFLRKLNDYFIKERLSDIIAMGRTILDLGSTDMKTVKAIKAQKLIGAKDVGQLEGLWQLFFEQYLLYLIFSYKKIFSKVELKDIEGDKKFPDFIGVNHYNGLDIIEIKTHLKNALSWDASHKNFYFSGEMSKAIVQTSNYMDAVMQERFKLQGDRRNITNHIDEENLYHPRGIIIISSIDKLAKKSDQKEKLLRDFTKLRNSVANIQILTFDEVLNIADEYTNNIINSDLDEQELDEDIN